MKANGQWGVLHPRWITILAGPFFCMLVAGFSILHSTGYVGVTRKNGGFGCICHGAVADESVTAWISGPASVRRDSIYRYTLLMTGGPAVAGGFNIAAGTGVLSAAEESTHTENGELTHSSPKEFIGDTLRWDFLYQPPSEGTSDTLFSAVNSVNRDSTPSGDAWNFGADFIVTLIPDTALGVAEAERPPAFRLYQNYPNPFNPVTRISYVVSPRLAGSRLTLKVYDLLGREVAHLADGKAYPGFSAAEWDATSMPGGIYLCRLQVGGAVEVRKMLLCR